MKIAFVTNSTGGGHLMRALAIKKKLPDAEFSIFGPPLDFPLAKAVGYRTGHVRRFIENVKPDLILADSDWKFISDIHAYPIWCLTRYIKPLDWFKGVDAEKIIAIEPIAEETKYLTDIIDPIVVAERAEMKPPDALGRLVGGTDIALVSGIRPGEVSVPAGYIKIDLRTMPPEWHPLCTYLSGATNIVANAGYNTFWEAHYLGYSNKVKWGWADRRHDDQESRIHSAILNWGAKGNGATQLASMIRDRLS